MMQPPYAHRPPPPASLRPATRSDDVKAVLAVVLGAASLTCLGPLSGIPAMILGALSRRAIERSRGALGGAGMAVAGIVMGAFGTLLGIVAIAGVAAVLLQRPDGDLPRADRVPFAAGTRSYGPVDVIELDVARPLGRQLDEIASREVGRGRTVILQTYIRSSHECADVAAALPDARMQRALAQVTLVRVDVERFAGELEEMKVEVESVPWFYKLDSRAHPTDAISADEWDENVAENMAPVLGDFARGTLAARRSPPPLGTAL